MGVMGQLVKVSDWRVDRDFKAVYEKETSKEQLER